jgi:hypothetical protein
MESGTEPSGVEWLLQATDSGIVAQGGGHVSQHPAHPTRRARAAVALLAGILSGVFVVVLYSRQAASVISDWDATWTGARALLGGRSPYAAVQMPPWPWRINYPMPAVLLSTPFALLPLWLARGVFVGVATAVFTFVVTRLTWWPLYFVLSPAMLWSWIAVKWEPLMVAAALTPALGWILTVKPTQGFALWAAYPRRAAVIGGLGLLALSFAVYPPWVQEWIASLAGTPHRPHLIRPLGFLLLLGLVRWRRPEGRLLAVVCLIPQTTALYEVLPLTLLVRTRTQAAIFAGLTLVAHLLYLLGPQGPWPVGAEYQWWVMLVLLYGPALALVLSHPNVGPIMPDKPPDFGVQ